MSNLLRPHIPSLTHTTPSLLPPLAAYYNAVLSGSLTPASSAEAATTAVREAAQRLRTSHGVAAEAVPALDDSCARLSRCRGLELSPVCAIMGGMLGTELVKLVSGKDEPINNLFVLDTQQGSGGCVVTLG
jgi:hypothetical protein